MSIKQTAYDTTACKGFILTRIIHEIKLAKLKGGVNSLQNDVHGLGHLQYVGGILFVETHPETASVPSFLHPVVYEEHPNNPDSKLVVSDQRVSTRWDAAQMNVFIKNINEYNFTATRAYLQKLWLTNDPEILLTNGKFAMQVYAKIISETITRALGLNPQDQLTISILSAYFYCCLHTNQSSFNDLEKTRLYSMISRAINTDMNTVMSMIEHIDPINDVDGLCNTIKEVTGNIRLDKFNWGILFSLLFNSWYGGTNSKELISVALEHPPTWIAMVLASLNDKTYKNSGIGKITLAMKQDQISAFTHGMANLLSTVS